MGEIATIRDAEGKGFVRVGLTPHANDLGRGQLVQLIVVDDRGESCVWLTDAQGETLETAIRAARRQVAHAAGGSPRR